MTWHGGRLLVHQLKRLGVDTVFGLFAGHLGPIFDACLDEGIRIVAVRHEEAAVHMAHAYARLRRTTGVALVTAGPGLTHATSGIAAAWSGRAPVLVIAGRWPTPQEHLGAFHEIDQIGVVRPITKWAGTCGQTTRLPEYVDLAWRAAATGGPAVLDVPTDVLQAAVDEAAVRFPAPPPRHHLPTLSSETVDEVLAALATAQRPIVLAGSGVWWAGAERALLDFLDAAGLPILTSIAARGIVPGDHPQHVGAARSYALREADLVLLLGGRLNWALAYGRPPRFSASTRFIQIDRDPLELGRNRDVDVAIEADLLHALQALTTGARPQPHHRSWLEQLQTHDLTGRARLTEGLTSERVPIHPLRLCAEVRRVLPREAVLIADGGDILSFARQGVDVYQPGGWLDAGAYGMIGHGVPMGLGAQVAWPHRPVAVVAGDGAFGFHAMEMETAVRNNLPVVVVVSNNGRWSIEHHTQLNDFGRAIATDLGPTDYAALGRALGAGGYRIERPEELRPALEAALRSGSPTVLDVITDPDLPSPDASRNLGSVPAEQAVIFKPES